MSNYSPRDQRIIDWQNADAVLTRAKQTEMDLRKAVYAECFPAAEVGTNTLELGKGFALKAVRKLNYNLANGAGETETALDLITKIGNEGSFIAERLVKWKPDLSVTEYKALQAKANEGDLAAKRILDIINEVLTISDGSPTLTVAEKKK